MLISRLHTNKVQEAVGWNDKMIQWCLKEANEKGFRECDFWGEFALDKMKIQVYSSLDLRPSSSICLLMLCHSIAWVWQRTGAQFGGGVKEQQIEGLVDFLMKLPKLPQTCPKFCICFYLTKRVGRQSDIIDGLFLFYLELYIPNSVVI